MDKRRIGAGTYLYPMPTVIIGAAVDGRPNFMTVAYCGICQHNPPMIAIALGKSHHTNTGIRTTRAFSVNIPSQDMAAVTDHVGIFSGRSVDKSHLFDIYYGTLATAPMIRECPLSLECRLAQIIDIGGSGEIFIGEIVETWAEEQALTSDGHPDIQAIRPLIFAMHDNTYWGLGEKVGNAWSIGREYAPPSGDDAE